MALGPQGVLRAGERNEQQGNGTVQRSSTRTLQVALYHAVQVLTAGLAPEGPELFAL